MVSCYRGHAIIIPQLNTVFRIHALLACSDELLLRFFGETREVGTSQELRKPFGHPIQTTTLQFHNASNLLDLHSIRSRIRKKAKNLQGKEGDWGLTLSALWFLYLDYF